MKKIIALALVLMLALSVVSCKKEETKTPEADNSKKAQEYINSQKEETPEAPAEEPAEEPQEKPLPSAEMPEVETESDWKEFLAEYEAWIDEYIVVFNKYKNNRQDKDILLEYAKMQQQLSEWNEKTEEYVIKLEVTPKVLEEYTNAVTRIAVKLTEGTMQ